MPKSFTKSIFILFTGTCMYAQNSDIDQRYDRNSLAIMFLDVSSREYATDIRNAFLRQNTPEKFDNHNIPLRAIPVNYNPAKEEDLGYRLERYLNEEAQAGKMMVAKWFNRDEYGRFNMNTVAARGKYNATDLDVKQALASKTGLAKIEDAGENLLNKTYVAVYSFRIFNKENTAKAVGAGLKIGGALLDAAGYGNAAKLMAIGGTVAENVRGFTCAIEVYLFKLDWSPQVSSEFYEKYWIDETSYNIEKAYAFENSNLFRLKYISKSTSTADVTGITVDGKENEQRIADLMTKTLPIGLKAIEGGHTVMAQPMANTYSPVAQKIAEQQGGRGQPANVYATSQQRVSAFGVSEFKVRARVHETKPYITAKIGLKEGLKPHDLYLVYEKQEGSTALPPRPVGSVRVKNYVWDNRYVADGKADTSNLTQFYSYYGRKPYKGLILEQKTQSKAYWSFNFGGITRQFIIGSRLDFGHSTRIGIGVNIISDRFYTYFEGNSTFDPFYYETSYTSYVFYSQLSQYINVGRGWYFEPFLSAGAQTLTFEFQYYTLNSSRTAFEESSIFSFDTEPFTAFTDLYVDAGLRMGINVSPTGTSLFAEGAVVPFPTLTFAAPAAGLSIAGYGKPEFSGLSFFNWNIGIRFKL